MDFMGLGNSTKPLRSLNPKNSSTTSTNSWQSTLSSPGRTGIDTSTQWRLYISLGILIRLPEKRVRHFPTWSKVGGRKTYYNVFAGGRTHTGPWSPRRGTRRGDTLRTRTFLSDHESSVRTKVRDGEDDPVDGDRIRWRDESGKSGEGKVSPMWP